MKQIALNVPGILKPQVGRYWVGLGVLGVLAAAGTHAAATHWWYRDRVAANVQVGSVTLGGLKETDAEKALAGVSPRATVTVQVGSDIIVIKREDVGARIDSRATVARAMEVDRPSWGGKTVTLDPVIRTDRKQLEAVAERIVTSRAKEASPARLTFTGGKAQVAPAQPGVEIDGKLLREKLAAAFASGTARPVVLPERVLTHPVAAETLAPLASEAETKMDVPLQMQFEGRTFTASRRDIAGWLTVNDPEKSPKLALNQNAIGVYAASIARQVDIMPIDKRIIVANGTSQVQTEGADGKRMDQDELARALRVAVESKQPLNYTIALLPAAKKTVATTLVGNTSGRLIEVSIGKQHVWAWEEGRVVYHSAITTGATGAGFPTVTGKFAIQSKQRDRYLNGRQLGYNYNVFVKYWMPFYQDYGLHDASWRRGKFGGQDYYYDGSHGCVNLPEATAAWLYNWSSIGTTVVVHK